MRICTLLPSATEIAFALGLGDEIVGVTHECDYPPEAREKRVVVKSLIDSEKLASCDIDESVHRHLREQRGIYTIDLLRFRAANPDYIITQDLCDVCALDYNEVMQAIKWLTHRPKIVSLAPTRLADVLRDIERIGVSAGKQVAANGLVRRLGERIERVRDQASRAKSRPRVACIEWLDPLYSAGHWVPEMVELAGGVDGLGKKGKPSEQISWEAVREFAPEVVVLMPCGFDVARTLRELPSIQDRPGWSKLPAVKAGRVFAVNGSAYFNRPGPRLVDGLEILAHIVHPELFPSLPPLEAAQRLSRQAAVRSKQ
jgi:iron complex transport system substrate-binding protein